MNGRLLKLLLIISLILNVVALFFAAKRILYKPTVPVNFPFEKLEDAKSRIFESLPITEKDTLMIGDSRVSEFPVELLPNFRFRGIPGITTSGILSVLPHIFPTKAKCVYLEVGINDFNIGVPFNVALDNYRKMVRIITRQQTSLVIVKVIPAGLEYAGINKRLNFDDLWQFNENLKKLALEYHAQFLDLPELGGRIINPAYTYDGAHLNIKGYEYFKRMLEHVK